MDRFKWMEYGNPHQTANVARAFMVNIRNANIRLRHCQKNRQMLAVFFGDLSEPVCTDGSRQAVARAIRRCCCAGYRVNVRRNRSLFPSFSFSWFCRCRG